MTDQQKKDNKNYKINNGFLQDNGKDDWSEVSKEDLEFIQSLPGFSFEIFKQCTGFDMFNKLFEEKLK